MFVIIVTTASGELFAHGPFTDEATAWAHASAHGFNLDAVSVLQMEDA